MPEYVLKKTYCICKKKPPEKGGSINELHFGFSGQGLRPARE